MLSAENLIFLAVKEQVIVKISLIHHCEESDNLISGSASVQSSDSEKSEGRGLAD